MGVVNYLLDNYIMLFELLGILVISIISIHLTKKIRRYLIIDVVLILVISILQNVENYLATVNNVLILRHFFSAFKYSLYPFLVIFLLPIASPFKKELDIKYKILILAPAVISTPLYLSSQWTKLVMYFEEYEHGSIYCGGPIKAWPYAIFVIYIVIFVVYNIFYLRRFSNMTQRVSLFITLGATLGIVLYLIFEKTDDYTHIFTAALLLYFIFFYIHLASVDPLTGLLNRQSYYKALSSTRIEAVISVDMNELKYLNDNFGHDAGDEGLQTIGSVLLSFVSPHYRAYRVGGDEFVILAYKIEGEDSIQRRISLLKEQMSKTKYSCAFGYAMNYEDDNDNIREVIKKADESMYLDKQAMKKYASENGGLIHFRD